MDPNACLQMIDEFLADQLTGPEVDEWCDNLLHWLSRDGFEPRWEDCPLGTSYFQCRSVVRARE